MSQPDFPVSEETTVVTAVVTAVVTTVITAVETTTVAASVTTVVTAEFQRDSPRPGRAAQTLALGH